MSFVNIYFVQALRGNLKQDGDWSFVKSWRNHGSDINDEGGCDSLAQIFE